MLVPVEEHCGCLLPRWDRSLQQAHVAAHVRRDKVRRDKGEPLHTTICTSAAEYVAATSCPELPACAMRGMAAAVILPEFFGCSL